MTFDPTSIKVTRVTLPKDHCVQYHGNTSMNVDTALDQFVKLTTYIYINAHTTYTHLHKYTEWVITQSFSELSSSNTKKNEFLISTHIKEATQIYWFEENGGDEPKFLFRCVLLFNRYTDDWWNRSFAVYTNSSYSQHLPLPRPDNSYIYTAITF